MSERLRHLQRQQALLREHLAWIEAEIAREAAPLNTTASLPAVVSNTSTPAAETPAPVPLPNASRNAEADSHADSLIERYATAERQNPRDIRRGCLLIFTAALLVISGAVATAWLIYYR